MQASSIFLQRRRAQSMVEFALIVPLLLILMFGVIELGIMFSIYVGMTNSAREGARAGAVYQTALAPAYDSLKTMVQLAKPIDDERLTYLSQVITDTIHPLIEPTTALTVTVSYAATPTTPQRVGDPVTVELDHDHPLFFGLFGTQKITIKAMSTMRIEPGATK
jgi:Flp pilus assembly protein TadG